MTIQNGSTPYVYPQSDSALPVLLGNMNKVRTLYGNRAYMASHEAVNPFKSDSPYILQGVTVIEHTDRYTGYLPYFPQGAEISSEAYPAARECARIVKEMAAHMGMVWGPNEHREPLTQKFFLTMFGLGQTGITVARVTPQSIVEHYLFNTKPVIVSEHLGKGLRNDQPYITPIPENGMAYFRQMLSTSYNNDWELDYYYSTKPGMTTHLFADWPAIPKQEATRLLGSYDIEALTQFYHGQFSALLSGVDRQNYIAMNWYQRIATLVRSAVLCQYFWSVRMLLNYPSTIVEVGMQMENGDPMLWEDGRKLMTEGYRIWE